MDEDIIATLIQENDMHRISQAELQKTADDLRNVICTIVSTNK